jgi:hypothetical protein
VVQRPEGLWLHSTFRCHEGLLLKEFSPRRQNTFVQGIFFSYLGNVFSLKGIEYSPNPGYSLIISKSYVVFTAIASIFIFSAPLTMKSVIAILLIVLFIIFAGGALLSQYLPGLNGETDQQNPGFVRDNFGDELVDILRNAKLSLETDSTKVVYQIGDEVKFNLILDTIDHNIVGVDAIINYSNDLVEVTSIETSSAFESYPVSKAENGKVMISGLKEIGKSNKGIFKVATITMKMLNKGEAKLDFDFKPLNTTDSNVVELNTGEDLLSNTNGYTLTIN